MRRLGRLASLLLLALSLSTTASERIEIGMGSIAGDGWRAENLQLAMNLNDRSGSIRIVRLALPQPVGEVRNVTIDCADFSVDRPVIHCRDGRFRLRHPQLGTDTFRGEIAYDRHNGRIEFTLIGVPVAGGRLRATGYWNADGWQVGGRATALSFDGLKILAAGYVALPEVETAGRLDAEYMLRGGAGTTSGRIRLQLAGATVATADGRIATEELSLQLAADLLLRGPHLTFAAQLSSKTGQLYAEPVFVDAGEFPFDIKANGHWNAARGELHLTDLRLRQPNAVDAEAIVYWQRDQGLRDLRLLLHDAVLPGAYRLYAQPFLIGTAVDSLATSGRLSGMARLTAGKPAAMRLLLDRVDLVDGNKRFALRRLGGVARWQARHDPTLPPSELHWQKGAIGAVDIGPARLRLLAYADSLELLNPIKLPVLDGTLKITTLRATKLGKPDTTLAFDAELTPVELRPISLALGWPEFGGTIAGRLPSLRYEGGRLTVGGRLEVEAFNGRIRVDGLQLDQPLGRVPRLSANIAIDELDLKALTETFSFGRIEGRLSGRIDQLRLVNWQPASFDARFYTPAGDTSRHRISQRAIQNLSSIGGGAAAILSRGFLRFFEDFAYDRIGLSCQLREDVCLMDGLAPAANGGYYIVRGRLLPRVDVIGYQREVSWPTLVEQLKSVTQPEGPVVQ